MLPKAARADEPTASDVEAPPRGYARLLGSIALGKGMRFNNPYRLQTQLGSTAKSVSLTASYLDLGAAALFGDPDGLEQGGALHLSFAIAGVPQAVLVPSYVLARPLGPRVLVSGRLGPALILSPDVNVGGELAASASVQATARLAVAAELLGDLFYGASTLDKKYTTYPILSGQIALTFQHEVLP